jgi:S1-C subfamily serine protease
MAIGTLRAMSPEEAGDDGTPEPDDEASGPPPNPLDRPWVHPTELSSFVATPDAPAREARPREWVIGISSAVAAVIATVLVLVAFGALGGRHRSPLPPPVVTNAGDVVDYAVAERVGETVAPSVVTVRVGGDTTKPVGSGVVLKSDRIITAAHLLNGATKVEVSTSGGELLPAHVVGSDAQTDLVLLAVSAEDLKLATLGSSSSLPIGRTVIAVTTTRGNHYRVGINVVSDRDVMVDAGTGIDVAGLLETGIPVSPDMAGGALVDANGMVVGILTRPAQAGPPGLAIPVAVVRDVEDQLDSSGSTGTVTHGWLGVLCSTDEADLPGGGAVIVAVAPESPAAKAGLMPGDIVKRAGGTAISGWPELVAAARTLRPQDPLDLQYERGGHQKSTTVPLGAGDPQVLAQNPGMG